MVTYEAAVKEIEALGMMPERPPSLEPMRKALTRMDAGRRIDPERVVIVAGTNGKGSVSATLEALLLSSGARVGLYTSPHLLETTERIRILGRDISRELFVEACQRVREVCSGIELSHFEMLTLMAVWVFFFRKPVDWAIFEVGLGGRWDATNAVPHSRCVITSLGFDHQNLLGNTIQEIAANKFDIVTPGAQVIHSPLPEQVLALAEEVRSRTGSTWTPAAPWKLRIEPVAPGDCSGDPVYLLATPWGEARIALAGARGAQNSATALTAFQILGFDPGRHLRALGQVRWRGRMERVALPGAPCPVYLSGDHNPQGMDSLLEILPAYPRRKLHLLVGVGRDKDLDGILKGLFELKDARVYLTETPFRGRPLAAYGSWLQRAEGAWKDPGKAIEGVLDRAQPGDRVVVTGSLYLVGEILRLAKSFV